MSKHTAHESSLENEVKHNDQNRSKKAERVEVKDDLSGKTTSDVENKAANTAALNDQPLVPESELLKLQEEANSKIAALESEISNLKDQYLRKAAEFENFRKRITREKQDAVEYANQSLLLDLVPVIDDFERAIKSSETARDYQSLHEGISLIEKQLVTQLENKWGLVRFDSAGEEFDPNKHEAIMMEKTTEVSEPTVAEDFLKGYTLKDRVIRSAKVKVLMPEDPESGSSTTAGLENEDRTDESKTKN